MFFYCLNTVNMNSLKVRIVSLRLISPNAALDILFLWSACFILLSVDDIDINIHFIIMVEV